MILTSFVIVICNLSFDVLILPVCLLVSTKEVSIPLILSPSEGPLGEDAAYQISVFVTIHIVTSIAYDS
jgi:hypothetical protein